MNLQANERGVLIFYTLGRCMFFEHPCRQRVSDQFASFETHLTILKSLRPDLDSLKEGEKISDLNEVHMDKLLTSFVLMWSLAGLLKSVADLLKDVILCI